MWLNVVLRWLLCLTPVRCQLALAARIWTANRSSGKSERQESRPVLIRVEEKYERV
jgi:hypothetical protein